MNREPDPKPRFNYTLRESLIAMVAIAALLALAVKSYENAQPFVSTGFFNSLDTPKARTIVTTIGRDLDIKTDQLGAGAGESSGGDSASRDIRLTVGVPPELHSKFVVALQEQMQRMLTEDECIIVSSAGASNGGMDDVTQFSFTYEKDDTRGHVFVHRVPAESDALSLFMLLHEFQR